MPPPKAGKEVDVIMLSRYSIVIPLPETEEFLVFNSLYGTAVVLNKELFSLIQSEERKPASLREKYCEEIATLHEMGILLSNGQREVERLRQWYRMFQNDSSYMNVTILSTFKCNLDCVYCYEEDRKRACSMDEQTTRNVIEWIKHKVEEAELDTLNITFYGGEPLLNVECIEHISNDLFPWLEERGIELGARIITNGVLLTKKMTRRLVECGIQSATVTLDGRARAHDAKRPFPGGAGTFDMIIHNLLDIRGEIDVNVTCNFDETNFESAVSLLDYLEQINLKPFISNLTFKPIKDMEQSRTSTSAFHCQGAGYTEDEVVKIMELQSRMELKGYPARKTFSLGPCEIHHRYSYTIDVEGYLYPCSGFVGMPSFRLGNVAGGSGASKDAFIDSLSIPAECTDCPYFTSCGGGCRYLSYIRTKDIHDSACELTYFETSAPYFLKNSLKQGIIAT